MLLRRPLLALLAGADPTRRFALPATNVLGSTWGAWEETRTRAMRVRLRGLSEKMDPFESPLKLQYSLLACKN
jgi:hypothetical protein